MRELKKQYSDINSIMPRHSCCEVRVMQLDDAHLCNPAGGYISWGIDSPTDTSLFLATYKGGSHLPADIKKYLSLYNSIMYEPAAKFNPFLPPH